jgi:hypothetical protein
MCAARCPWESCEPHRRDVGDARRRVERRSSASEGCYGGIVRAAPLRPDDASNLRARRGQVVMKLEDGMLSTQLDEATMRDIRATPEAAECRGTRPSASA